MLQIEIDGKQIAVKQGTTVIEAANELGKYIPHFKLIDSLKTLSLNTITLCWD